MIKRQVSRSSRWREGLTVLAVASAPVLFSGCDALDDLLSVELPSEVPADALRTSESAELLVASAENALRCAFTNYINVSAYVSSEFAIATFAGATIFYDQRFWRDTGYWALYAQADCGGGSGLYLPLSRARWLGDDVLSLFDDEWNSAEVTDYAALRAQVAAFTGYSYVFMGESMCTVAFDAGLEQDTDAAFDLAVARFDDAIASAGAGEPEFAQLAQLGKARALLNLGRLPEAEAAAALVQPDFRYLMDYSGAEVALYNKVWQANARDNSATVEESYRGMAFAGDPDPRVRVSDAGVNGAGTTVAIWTADKYNGPDSPIELGTWEEAQLIIAEAAVADGRLQDAVDIINVLHANVEPELTSFASTDAGEIMDQIIYERRAELFLEGHQLGDIRRYGLPLIPAPGEPFIFGGTYGDQTCFPLPAVEYRNNPNITRP